MKRGIYLLAIMLGVGGLVTSCEDYFEENIADPNNPTEVTPDLLLSNIEVATFANFGGQLARQTQMLVQQAAGTVEGSQTVEIMNYNITELTNENEWGVIYSGALVNSKILIEDFGGSSPHYAGIAKVLTALNLACATDLWGSVPYSEALEGQQGNLTPAYDSQEELYDPNNPNSIFSILDDAIADLNQPSEGQTYLPSTDDMIYGGDVQMWIKAANALKARYYNRLSEVNPASSATNALQAINDGAISSSAENMMMYFGTGGNSLNQWFAYEQARPNYIKMADFFVTWLDSIDDPRLPFYADQDTGGAYSGVPTDDLSRTFASSIGPYLSAADAPIPLMAYHEVKFIEAEAKLRDNDPAGAATAYNEAVVASVEFVTGSAIDPTFESEYANEDASSITQEKIMRQKYIALFGRIESYNEWRRTDIPTLTPANGAQIPTIPLRLIIPQNERLYNPSVVTAPLTEPVWWDN